MLWTCACCGFQQVEWRPQTCSEAQVKKVVRARCRGRTPKVLEGARGFVYLGDAYAPDRPVKCPRCRQSFYPGDSVRSAVPEHGQRRSA